MTDEYLTIKIDAGLLMRKIEEWKASKHNDPKADNDIILSVGRNDMKTADNHPLYRGRSIAVWHNKTVDAGNAVEETVS